MKNQKKNEINPQKLLLKPLLKTQRVLGENLIHMIAVGLQLTKK